MTTKEYDELNKLYEALKVEKAIAERDRDKYKQKKEEYKKKLGEQSSSSVPNDYDKQKEKAEKYKEYKNAFEGRSADEIKRELTEAKEKNEKLEKKLEKKKKKIEKLRNSPQQSAGTDGKSELYKEKADSLEKELTKWRYLFPDQEPEKLKEFAEKARGHEETLKELERKLEVAKEGSVSEDINKISVEIREVATKYVDLGKETGGFLLSPIGGLIGASLATTQGFMAVGVYTCENVRRSIQEITEKSMDVGVDVYKTTLDKTQWYLDKSGNDIVNILEKGMDITKWWFSKSGDDIKDFVEGLTGTRSEKEKIEILTEELKKGKKLFEEQLEASGKILEGKETRIKELMDDREEKKEEIKYLKKEKEKLREQVDKLLEAKIEVRTK